MSAADYTRDELIMESVGQFKAVGFGPGTNLL